MKRSSFIICILCAIALQHSGCLEDAYFGQSEFKSILYFTLSQQAGTTQINEDSLIIRIPVSSAADLTSLYCDSIRLSSYATINPGVFVPQDFSVPVIYTVTAEDGTIANYQVIVSQQSENPQLTNSSFDDWYTPAGKNYEEPGADASTIWATGNAGVVTLGTANTTPLTISGTDLAAQMVTKDLGLLAQITGQRMGAATMFTGTFKLNITDPISSAMFGTPYTSRPTGLSVDYTYIPMTPYKNGSGQVLSKTDSCDIYFILENRSGSEPTRVATGWFRSGDTVTDFTTIEIPLTYGPLPAGTPDYQLPINGMYASPSDPVTHLSIVFTSSAYGAQYEGGVNSTLVVNNLVLNY